MIQERTKCIEKFLSMHNFFISNISPNICSIFQVFVQKFLNEKIKRKNNYERIKLMKLITSMNFYRNFCGKLQFLQCFTLYRL